MDHFDFFVAFLTVLVIYLVFLALGLSVFELFLAGLVGYFFLVLVAFLVIF